MNQRSVGPLVRNPLARRNRSWSTTTWLSSELRGSVRVSVLRHPGYQRNTLIWCASSAGGSANPRGLISIIDIVSSIVEVMWRSLWKATMNQIICSHNLNKTASNNFVVLSLDRRNTAWSASSAGHSVIQYFARDISAAILPNILWQVIRAQESRPNPPKTLPSGDALICVTNQEWATRVQRYPWSISKTNESLTKESTE